MSLAPLVVAVAAGVGGVAVLAFSPPATPVLPAASVSPVVRAAPVVPGAPSAGVGPVAPVGAVARPAAPAARFRWPLSPVPQVLRRFVVGPQRWSPGHRGVDLAAAAGQPVLSAGPGTVTFAGSVAGRGVVAVTHPGGIRTTYEPVTATVRAGQAVAAGTPLGVLAGAGHCRGACLHWGALRGDVYLDPLTLLRPPSPPILLPLAASG